MRVENRFVLFVKNSLEERRVVDAVHHDEQLVEREPAAHAHPAREHEVRDAARAARDSRSAPAACGRALREQAVAPGAGLEDQVAGRVERAVRAEEEVARRFGAGSRPARRRRRRPPSAWRRMPTASISSMKTMHWPPHFRASFFARRARIRTMIASMPMNVAAKPEPGIEMNGELNPSRSPSRASSCPCRARRGRAGLARACRRRARTARPTARSRRPGAPPPSPPPGRGRRRA